MRHTIHSRILIERESGPLKRFEPSGLLKRQDAYSCRSPHWCTSRHHLDRLSDRWTQLLCKTPDVTCLHCKESSGLPPAGPVQRVKITGKQLILSRFGAENSHRSGFLIRYTQEQLSSAYHPRIFFGCPFLLARSTGIRMEHPVRHNSGPQQSLTIRTHVECRRDF